jgi:hypothetical protein
MATDSATTESENPSMPSGISAVCLFHLGIGALAVLGGLGSLVFSPFVGVFAVLLGLVLLALGYGLMELRRRAWRRTIAFHAIDIIVGLSLIDGFERIGGVAISALIIVYLYSRKSLFIDGSER